MYYWCSHIQAALHQKYLKAEARHSRLQCTQTKTIGVTPAQLSDLHQSFALEHPNQALTLQQELNALLYMQVLDNIQSNTITTTSSPTNVITKKNYLMAP